ncbi:MAG: hypothetical protein Q8L95_02765 [Burkholderiales bacterium]|nr:hypothetical protein [Burkholderiales bacterium]
MSAPLSNAPRDWLRWLDRIPLLALVVAAVLLGPAPFVPEPHVWEKLKMLAAGTLIRPIDIFDLLWHAAPLVLLGMKLMRRVGYKNTNKNN